ncbi:MAG: DUF4142 domain-containing protein [Deltaproteobacteria bacterium]|nr:DUF4142 domain-containing protein [Deltaproteobacteria bacterium]
MHKSIRWASLAVVSLAIAGAASAESKDKPMGMGKGGSSAAMCPHDDNAKLKSVLEFLHTANQNEIKHSKLAMERSTSKDVKAFADRMVREHTDADKKLTDLAQKKGIDLSPTMPMDPIHAAVHGADAKMDEALKTKSGAQFDAAYLGPEMMEHVLVLAVIEEGQKVAKDDEVKKLLSDMHKGVDGHREHVMTMMSKMKMPGGAAIGGGPGTDESGSTSGTKGKSGMDKPGTDKSGMDKSGPGKPGMEK